MQIVRLRCLLSLFLTTTCYALHVPSKPENGLKVSAQPFNGRYRNKLPWRKSSRKLDSSLQLSPVALRIAEIVAPKMGVCTANALYFAPIPAVLRTMRSGEIGDLNPLPLAVMPIVALGWLAYGLSACDPHVTLSNIFGTIFTTGYVVGILPALAKNKEKLRMTQGAFMAGISSTLLLWTYMGMARVPRNAVSSMLGLFATALFIILSGSPLSTIKTVVSTRDSSSILGSLTAGQVTNTALWTAYGLTVKDRFIWGPNIAGLSLGLVQLALKLIFPSKKTREETPLPEVVNGSDTPIALPDKELVDP